MIKRYTNKLPQCYAKKAKNYYVIPYIVISYDEKQIEKWNKKTVEFKKH